jgi:cell division protein FtsB
MFNQDLFEKLFSVVQNQSRNIETLSRSIHDQHKELEMLKAENKRLNSNMRDLEDQLSHVRYAH